MSDFDDFLTSLSWVNQHLTTGAGTVRLALILEMGIGCLELVQAL